MIPRGPRVLAATVCLTTLVWLPLARAAPLAQPPPGPPPAPAVPLSANFSTLESVTALVVAGAGSFLLTQGNLLFDPPKPSMGVPDPGSIDARLSRWMYRSDGQRFLWGVPDHAGAYVLPVLPALYYGIDWLALAHGGHPLLASRDLNPQHRFLAFAEALGWTFLFTGLAKYTAGRPRPYTAQANDHPSLRRRASEDNLSFFSGHASGTFCVGAFLAEDVSRYLLRGPLSVEAGAGAGSRLVLGRLAPYLVGYGVPVLVSVSRLVDQQHWPSDVVTGAVTGALIAHLVYAVHFDAEGNPRRRHRSAGQLLPITGQEPGGVHTLMLAYQQRF
jgi:membrane-associated phospholipid phosphatase